MHSLAVSPTSSSSLPHRRLPSLNHDFRRTLRQRANGARRVHAQRCWNDCPIHYVKVLVPKYLSGVVHHAILCGGSHVAAAQRMWGDERLLPPGSGKWYPSSCAGKGLMRVDLSLKSGNGFCNVPLQIEAQVFEWPRRTAEFVLAVAGINAVREPRHGVCYRIMALQFCFQPGYERLKGMALQPRRQ